MRVLLLLTMLFSPALYAAEKNTQLHHFLNQLKTYQTSFVQYVFNHEDGSFNTTGGKLYIDRPDKFRWEYSGEEGQLIIGDGLSIWLQDRELEQVTQQFQSIALKGTPADILLGAGNIDDIFIVEELSSDEGKYRYLLLPRADDSQFTRIEMTLQNDQLIELLMINQFGQESRLEFNDIIMNQPLNPELFVFQRPEGYDFFEH